MRLEVPGQRTRTEVYCLDPYGLCAAKLTRLEEKDRLRRRVEMMRDPRFTIPLRAQAQDFLNAFLLEHTRTNQRQARTRKRRHLR